MIFQQRARPCMALVPNPASKRSRLGVQMEAQLIG